jgi:chromosome segregation ATPase
MAVSVQDTIQNLKTKAAIILDRHALLLKEYDDATERIQQLEATIDSLRKDVEQLSLENEYLKVASIVATTEEDIERSRAILSELVRDIDKCITELND